MKKQGSFMTCNVICRALLDRQMDFNIIEDVLWYKIVCNYFTGNLEKRVYLRMHDISEKTTRFFFFVVSWWLLDETNRHAN